LLSVFFLSTVVSCDILENLFGGPEENHDPSVTLEADNEAVETGTTVTVTAVAVDLDDDNLSYEWYLEDVLQDVSEESVTWTPDIAGTYTIMVVVYDGSGSASDSIDIVVTDPRLAAPANLSASQQIYTSTIQLSWSAVSGAVGYRVFEAIASTGTYTAFETDVSGTSANIIDVPYGVTRYYKVAAIDSGDIEGIQSEYTSGTTFKDGLVDFADDGSGDWIQFYTNRTEDKNMFWWDTLSGISHVNGEFTAEIKIMSGDTDTYGHGIVFDCTSDDSYKFILINREGYYYIGQYENLTLTNLNEPSGDGWTESWAINKNVGEINKIRGDYTPSVDLKKYELFINDVEVYQENALGLTISSGVRFCAEVADDEIFPSIPVDVRYRITAPTAFP